MDEAYRLKGVAAGDEIEIKDGMVVGRNADCDLVLTGGHPSRKHARLTLKPDGVWVEDLGSANGTFVNGQQISAPKRLGPGDLVAFDVNEFELLAPAAAEPATVVRRPNDVPTVARNQPSKGAQADAAAPKAPPAARPTPAVATPTPTPASPTPAATPRSAAPPKAEPKPAAEPKPPPRPAAEAKPKAEPPAATPAMASSAPVDKGVRKPGAWVLPEYKENAAGTKLFSPAELKAMQEELNTPQMKAPSDAPYLNVLSGASNGQSIKLQSDKPRKQWEIGSEASRDIVLVDPGVSGFHAKIVNEGNRWKLIDQMSANHTYVNDQQANISFLKAGDRIRFGTVECMFLLPSGLAATGAGRKPWIIGAVAFVVTAAVITALVLM